MDIEKIRQSIPSFLKKYRYALIVLLVGFVLMLIPERSTKNTEKAVTEQPELPSIESVEEQLSQLLSQMDGAGKVEVMLTEAKGEEIVYQADGRYASSADTSDHQTTTVILTDNDRNESGLVRQKNPPQYQGAIVLCQGADSPSIRLAITEAVAKVTGLGTDCIIVLKMT